MAADDREKARRIAADLSSQDGDEQAPTTTRGLRQRRSGVARREPSSEAEPQDATVTADEKSDSGDEVGDDDYGTADAVADLLTAGGYTVTKKTLETAAEHGEEVVDDIAEDLSDDDYGGADLAADLLTGGAYTGTKKTVEAVGDWLGFGGDSGGEAEWPVTVPSFSGSPTYYTSDGKRFDNLEEAEAHQEALDAPVQGEVDSDSGWEEYAETVDEWPHEVDLTAAGIGGSSMYYTSDGRQFTDRESAEAHQNTLGSAAEDEEPNDPGHGHGTGLTITGTAGGSPDADEDAGETISHSVEIPDPTAEEAAADDGNEAVRNQPFARSTDPDENASEGSSDASPTAETSQDETSASERQPVAADEPTGAGERQSVPASTTEGTGEREPAASGDADQQATDETAEGTAEESWAPADPVNPHETPSSEPGVEVHVGGGPSDEATDHEQTETETDEDDSGVGRFPIRIAESGGSPLVEPIESLKDDAREFDTSAVNAERLAESGLIGTDVDLPEGAVPGMGPEGLKARGGLEDLGIAGPGDRDAPELGKQGPPDLGGLDDRDASDLRGDLPGIGSSDQGDLVEQLEGTQGHEAGTDLAGNPIQTGGSTSGLGVRGDSRLMSGDENTGQGWNSTQDAINKVADAQFKGEAEGADLQGLYDQAVGDLPDQGSEKLNALQRVELAQQLGAQPDSADQQAVDDMAADLAEAQDDDSGDDEDSQGERGDDGGGSEEGPEISEQEAQETERERHEREHWEQRNTTPNPEDDGGPAGPGAEDVARAAKDLVGDKEFVNTKDTLVNPGPEGSGTTEPRQVEPATMEDRLKPHILREEGDEGLGLRGAVDPDTSDIDALRGDNIVDMPPGSEPGPGGPGMEGAEGFEDDAGGEHLDEG